MAGIVSASRGPRRPTRSAIRPEIAAAILSGRTEMLLRLRSRAFAISGAAISVTPVTMIAAIAAETIGLHSSISARRRNSTSTLRVNAEAEVVVAVHTVAAAEALPAAAGAAVEEAADIRPAEAIAVARQFS